MSHIVFLIFAITLNFSAVAQKILILKNGGTIEFKRWKLFKDHIRILDSEREKSEIDINEIDGYFDTSQQKRYYKKPAPSDIFATKNSLTYEFVQREVEGEISLYKSIQYNGSYMTTASGTAMPSAGTDYYIEKNDVYRWVFTGRSQKDETLHVMKTILADDEALVEKMNAMDFKINIKNIIELIREYNVKSFTGVAPSDYHDVGTVGFYARIIGMKVQDLSLKVNDSVTYQIPENTVLNVRLPLSPPSKVCFAAGSSELCNLISASPFMMPHYELRVNMKDLSLEMEPKGLAQVQSYLYDLNYK